MDKKFERDVGGKSVSFSVIQIDAIESFCSHVLQARGRNAVIIAESFGLSYDWPDKVPVTACLSIYLDRIDTIKVAPSRKGYRHAVIGIAGELMIHSNVETAKIRALLVQPERRRPEL